MKVVLQRVTQAQVSVAGEVCGAIGTGAVVLFGVGKNDDECALRWMIGKVLNLRMFSDERGKMNHSLLDVEGELLVVSQFTLYGECRSGRRPDFGASASPDVPEPLYEKFVQLLREEGIRVETGIFGAKMSVQIVNDGPVTFLIENP